MILSLRRLFQSSGRPCRPASDASEDAKIIPRTVVRTAIVDALGPLLQAQGFERFSSGKCWRWSDGVTDVVEVKFIASYTLPKNSLSLHLGRYLGYVPPDGLTGPVPMK